MNEGGAPYGPMRVSLMGAYEFCRCGSAALVRVTTRPREGPPVDVLVCSTCGVWRRAPRPPRDLADPWWAR